MTLFIIILVVAAVIWLMVFKTKKEKEAQGLSVKPAETSIMSTPALEPAEPAPAPAPESPKPQEPLPPTDNPQQPQGPTW